MSRKKLGLLVLLCLAVAGGIGIGMAFAHGPTHNPVRHQHFM